MKLTTRNPQAYCGTILAHPLDMPAKTACEDIIEAANLLMAATVLNLKGDKEAAFAKLMRGVANYSETVG